MPSSRCVVYKACGEHDGWLLWFSCLVVLVVVWFRGKSRACLVLGVWSIKVVVSTAVGFCGCHVWLSWLLFCFEENLGRA